MISFGDIGPRVRPAEHRNKAAEDAKARLNALPAECCTSFTSGLSMQMREGLAVAVRAIKTAGGPCMIHRSDIATPLGITLDGGGRILDRLEEIGVLERRERIAQAPVFALVTPPPAAPPSHHARKADPAPVAPEPRRRASSVTDARLKAGLVGMRNHEEPPKLDLRDGIVGANPRR